ncbi:MAG: hypothetical protein IKL79_01570 [Clostridia bacterium]|nr:hypothetical protein [Clostridia bacterium]
MEQLTTSIEQMSQQLVGIYQQMTGTFLGVIGFCLALVLLAFYSYRILRVELSASAAIGGGALGYLVLAPLILSKIQGLPDGVDFAAVIGIACAILGWIIAWALHKLAIFLVGAGGGFYAGMYVFIFVALKWPEVEFLHSEAFFWIVCGVLALAAGIIFVYLFKPLYILVTAVGGTVAAAYLLGASVFGANVNNVQYLTPVLTAGAILGIIAAVVQFKKANE